MPYAIPCDSLIRLVTAAHDGNPLTGPQGITFEKIVNFLAVAEGGHFTAVCQALEFLGATCFVRFLGLDSQISHTATAGNIVATFAAGDEAAATITMGPFKAGSVRKTLDKFAGPMVAEQEFVHEGTSLTDTIIM